MDGPSLRKHTGHSSFKDIKMSAMCNQAVRDGWKREANRIREPLKKQMSELGMDLDRMLAIMLENSTKPEV